jgi:hypothetical protein
MNFFTINALIHRHESLLMIVSSHWFVPLLLFMYSFVSFCDPIMEKMFAFQFDWFNSYQNLTQNTMVGVNTKFLRRKKNAFCECTKLDMGAASQSKSGMADGQKFEYIQNWVECLVIPSTKKQNCPAVFKSKLGSRWSHPSWYDVVLVVSSSCPRVSGFFFYMYNQKWWRFMKAKAGNKDLKNLLASCHLYTVVVYGVKLIPFCDTCLRTSSQ